MSMEYIESEIRYGKLALLPSGRTYREKYRLGYGANGFHYHIYKRGGKWEAHVSYKSGYAQNNIEKLPIEHSFHVTRTLKDMNEWLKNLSA